MDKTLLILLVLSGGAVWGVYNVLRRYYFQKREAQGFEVPVEVAVVATMLGASVFAFGAQLVWSVWFGMPKVSISFWWFFAVVAVLNVVIELCDNKASKIEEASIVAPLQGLTPVLVIPISLLMLDEFPTMWGLIGIVVAVFGVYILALKRSDDGSAEGLLFPWKRLFQSGGARFAVLTALFGALALNFDKLAVVESSPMIRTAAVFLAVAVSVWSVSVATGRWKQLDKSCFWPLFWIGMVIGLADVLMSWGFLYGIVPYVASLKRFQIIVTTILAGFFLHEGDWAVRLIGSAIIFGGILLIAF